MCAFITDRDAISSLVSYMLSLAQHPMPSSNIPKFHNNLFPLFSFQLILFSVLVPSFNLVEIIYNGVLNVVLWQLLNYKSNLH